METSGNMKLLLLQLWQKRPWQWLLPWHGLTRSLEVGLRAEHGVLVDEEQPRMEKMPIVKTPMKGLG